MYCVGWGDPLPTPLWSEPFVPKGSDTSKTVANKLAPNFLSEVTFKKVTKTSRRKTSFAPPTIRRQGTSSLPPHVVRRYAPHSPSFPRRRTSSAPRSVVYSSGSRRVTPPHLVVRSLVVVASLLLLAPSHPRLVVVTVASTRLRRVLATVAAFQYQMEHLILVSGL